MSNNIKYNPAEETDDELNIDIKKLFMIVWNRKIMLLEIFFGVFIFFILLTFILPKKYKVEADLYINRANNTNLTEINPYAIEEMSGFGGLSQMMNSSSESMLNELEIIQSPLVIDKVIRDNNFVIKKKWGFIPNKKEGEYISTKAFLKKNISFENKKGTNVVTIEYKAKKPDVAYNVVCSIITNYIEVTKELHSEKAKNDTKVLEAEYNKVKVDLNNQIKKTKGLPSTALTGTGNIAALSAFSNSAGKAVSAIENQYITGTKSQIDLQEEAQKMTQIATKLQWAKMVEEMSDSSKVLVLSAPTPLRDFEYSSPKLWINALLGLVFGYLVALLAMVIAELTDKKLPYSKLDKDIIYNDKKKLFYINKLLFDYKDQNIACILFENPEKEIMDLLSGFKNLSIVKAEFSKALIDNIDKCDSVILMSKIGVTDAELYKSIKETLQIHNKQILKEILI